MRRARRGPFHRRPILLDAASTVPSLAQVVLDARSLGVGQRAIAQRGPRFLHRKVDGHAAVPAAGYPAVHHEVRARDPADLVADDRNPGLARELGEHALAVKQVIAQ